MHSQSLREKPLEPWVIAKNDGIILSGQCHCTCMAGLGESCTHVAALLFLIDATVRIRDSKTPTESKAYWLLPSSLKSVEYKEVKDIDFTSSKSLKKKLDVAIGESESLPASQESSSPQSSQLQRSLSSSLLVQSFYSKEVK